MINDQEENVNIPEGESFAELLEASDSGAMAELKPGDKIKGAIISVEKDTVFVDAGAKVDGVAEKDELLNDEGEFPYQPGDEIELYVVRATANEIRLSKALSGQGSVQALQDAFDSSVPVEGKVRETCKGGFRVRVMGRMAFCPVSQMDARFVDDPESFVGATHRFQIIKFEENGRNVVLSRRVLLEAEREEQTAEFFSQTNQGDVVEGTVVRLAPFGAFVEIAPGVEGLVHVSELSWSRVDKPEDVVAQGDKLTVKVLDMAPAEGKKQPKISLSVKQAQEDPWNTVADKLVVGEKVTGKVIRLAKFGAFVEVLPGIDGLVHISAMSYAKRVNDPSEIVQPGDTVSVMIKEVDVDKKRVSLSIKDAEGDPWLEVEDKFQPGTTVAGTLESRAQFGLFINLMPGVTGLMPKSRVARSPKAKELETMPVGETVTVVVEELNLNDRKITLAPEGMTEDQGAGGDWKSYAKPRAKSGASAPQGMGLLGEKLAEAMKGKK